MGISAGHCEKCGSAMPKGWCIQCDNRSRQARAVNKPGRNAPCPCGSKKKFKKCCMGKDTTVIRQTITSEQAQRMMMTRTIPNPHNYPQGVLEGKNQKTD